MSTFMFFCTAFARKMAPKTHSVAICTYTILSVSHSVYAIICLKVPEEEQ